MPNRIIRDSARTSKTLDAVSADEERMFFRLTLVADDFGRFQADPRILLAGCFPLKVGVLHPADVEKWRDGLVAVGLIQLYGVGDRLYGYFPSWFKHQQRMRSRVSKFPEPLADSDETRDSYPIAIGQLSDGSPTAGLSDSYPIAPSPSPSSSPSETQTPTETENQVARSRKRKKDQPLDPPGFGEFWSAYPFKGPRVDALKAWREIDPDPELQAEMLAALERQKGWAIIAAQRAEFLPRMPDACRWLKKRRWTDEPPTWISNGHQVAEPAETPEETRHRRDRYFLLGEGACP